MPSTYSSSSSYTTGGSTSITQSQSKTAATGKVDANTQAKFDKYNQDYVESDRVASAYQNLQNTINSKPGDFVSAYQPQLDSIYSQIMNGEKFKFNVNDSILYRNMKDQYSALGKMAMKDTMGQAASMTGGYGSSYSQTAGQQSYQNYIQQLNEQMPSIYQMELNQYNSQRQDLYNQLNATNQLYGNEYSQYRDKVADWQSDRNFYQSAYQSERDYDLSKWQSDRSYWNSEYWNERNAEQTTTSWSRTDTSSWQNTITNGYSYSSGSSGSSSSSSTSKKNTGKKTTPSKTNTKSNISYMTGDQQLNYLKQNVLPKARSEAEYNRILDSAPRTINQNTQNAIHMYGFVPDGSLGSYNDTRKAIENYWKYN